MSTDVALPSDFETTGLEDFDPNEAAIPRISIVQDEGVFQDNLSGEQFPVVTGVILGLIKQRTMWAPEVTDGAKPMCKSQDAETGYPNVTGPEESLFPWQEYGSSVDQVDKDEYGRPTLNCGTCPFAEWTDGRGTDRKPPACSERYTMPIRYVADSNKDVSVNDLDRSGILSFQRSGITPAKRFISGFSRAKRPMFTKKVQIKLELQKRGKVTYSVPVFTTLSETPQEDWEEYVKEYRGLRDFLRGAPRPPQGGETTEPVKASATVGTNASAGKATSTSAASSVIDSVATSVNDEAPSADEDDLPF